jgi:RecQ-mediated genome instability protein 1
MLKFLLSDGRTTVTAIEYRSIPQLELGVTPLGYKLLLKKPLMRNGIAFLEPACIALIGGHVKDREVNQLWDFKRKLGVRLG